MAKPKAKTKRPATRPQATATASTKPKATAKPRPKAKATAKATPKAKATAKATPKTKATPKMKAKTTPTPKAKTTPTPKAKTKPTPKAKTTAQPKAKTTAQPKATAKAPARRKPAPRKPAPRPASAGRVVEILDDEHPIDALRRFLSTIDGDATIQQGQVALGSAQLMLLPIAREHRGGPEVKALLDLVTERWSSFPEPEGFHAQEFLRNAFAAVGDDPERIAQLIALVPSEPSAELRFHIASAYALVGDKPAMMQALQGALAAGATASQVRRDNDFAAFIDDADVIALLDGSQAPVIPLDVTSHVAPVRAAVESIVSSLRELGQQSMLNPPASLDTVLAIERAKHLQLPNDYRALLTITDGMRVWDNEFLGTIDYRGDTKLARRAREYLAKASDYGSRGIDECVPLANWGQPDDWLLYDPRGHLRGGEPGYVLMLDDDETPLYDLVAALERLERMARDILGTN